MDKLVSANTLKFDNKVDINREIILSETIEVSFAEILGLYVLLFV